jgi:hypothetical protein
MADCQHEGCGAVATSAVKVCVPAKSWPIPLHTPLSIVLGLKFCWHHAKNFNVQEVLGSSEKLGEPGLRPLFIWMAKSAKGLPPDFKRAFAKVIALDDPEYKMLEQEKAAP